MLRSVPSGGLKAPDGTTIEFLTEKVPVTAVVYGWLEPGDPAQTRMQTTLWPALRGFEQAGRTNARGFALMTNDRILVPGATLVLGVVEHHAYVLVDGRSGWIHRRALETREAD